MLAALPLGAICAPGLERNDIKGRRGGEKEARPAAREAWVSLWGEAGRGTRGEPWFPASLGCRVVFGIKLPEPRLKRIGAYRRAKMSEARPFRMRIHRQGREVLVAVSDAGLVGREFREGNMRLAVHESFYGTEPADAHDVLRQLAVCTIANLVGVETVMLAIQHGFVNPDNVLDIEGVPHAQLCTA